MASLPPMTGVNVFLCNYHGNSGVADSALEGGARGMGLRTCESGPAPHHSRANPSGSQAHAHCRKSHHLITRQPVRRKANHSPYPSQAGGASSGSLSA